MRHLTTCLLLLALPALLGGCIERTFSIRSNPADCQLIIDGEEVGTTPYSQHFMHYGTRQFILSKEGYQRLKVNQPIDPPWYEKFPVGMITELFWPKMVLDHRDFYYRLHPQKDLDKGALLNDAEKLKARTMDIEDIR